MKKRIVLVAMVIALVAVPIALYVRVRAAEAAWARSFGDFQSIPARFPSRQNETADKVPRWVSELGVNDVPGLRAAIADYVSAVDTSELPAPQTPPPEVDWFVSGHAAQLDDIASFVAAHDAPAWHVRLGDVYSVPALLPLMTFEKALIAAAYVRQRNGDAPGAERLLAASWKINQGLQRRPELISQLIAIAIQRLHCVAARKIDVDPVAWEPRLTQHDYRASMVASLEVETWMRVSAVKTNVYADPDYLSASRALNYGVARSRAAALLTTPLRWFDLPAVMEGARQLVLEGKRAPITDGTTDDLDRAHDRGFQTWAYIGEPDMSPLRFSSSLKRADRVVAEQEFATRVLMARAARKANGGRWPASIEGFSTSRIRGGRWLYEPAGDHVTIRFDRLLRWPTLLGDDIPLRVVL